MHKPHWPAETGNPEVFPGQQSQKSGFQLHTQAFFWEMQVSYSEAEEKCKDAIHLPTFPESISIDFSCVPNLKPAPRLKLQK